MKRCPTCGKTFTDPNLSFCIDDGTPLLRVEEPLGSSSNEETIVSPSAGSHVSDPSRPSEPAYQPPGGYVPRGTPPGQPGKRKTWPWVIAIVAIVLLIFAGLGVAVIPALTSQRWLHRYFRLSIFIFSAMFFMFWIWFPVAAASNFRSADFVFHTFNNGISQDPTKQASDAYCWVISLLFGAWEFGGYDASAHLFPV